MLRNRKLHRPYASGVIATDGPVVGESAVGDGDVALEVGDAAAEAIARGATVPAEGLMFLSTAIPESGWLDLKSPPAI